MSGSAGKEKQAWWNVMNIFNQETRTEASPERTTAEASQVPHRTSGADVLWQKENSS